MSVNLSAPDRNSLLPVKGVRLGCAKAQLKKTDRKDLLLIHLSAGSHLAAVFTKNRFCAAPVQVSQHHLATGAEIRALLINAGNANAGTGEDGLMHARHSCEALAGLLGIEEVQVLPFSTGVIMEPLPIDRILAGLPDCVSNLDENNWGQAAQSIMTTDLVAKACSRQVSLGGKTVTITGIAKGSGMIHPNMATMLAYITTDAAVSQQVLNAMVRQTVNCSFNCITVDGDTSTNDAYVLMATGHAGNVEIDTCDGADYVALCDAVTAVATTLAQAIVRDGEGATKFITIKVRGGRNVAECRKVAYAVAHSPLVKTAFFASDPNLGRILAAVGYAGIEDMDVSQLKLYLDALLVAENGGRALHYTETDGQRVMNQSEITIRLELGRGDAQATVWTCDFSYDYVKINADYRT